MTNQTNIKDERPQDTPEDVAALYAWANLHNVKYRDFSENRREVRAQQQTQRPAVVVRPEPPKPLPKVTAVAATAPRDALKPSVSDSVISRRTGKPVFPGAMSVPGKTGDPYIRTDRSDGDASPRNSQSESKQKLERFAAELDPVFHKREATSEHSDPASAQVVTDTPPGIAEQKPPAHVSPDFPRVDQSPTAIPHPGFSEVARAVAEVAASPAAEPAGTAERFDQPVAYFYPEREDLRYSQVQAAPVPVTQPQQPSVAAPAVSSSPPPSPATSPRSSWMSSPPVPYGGIGQAGNQAPAHFGSERFASQESYSRESVRPTPDAQRRAVYGGASDPLPQQRVPPPAQVAPERPAWLHQEMPRYAPPSDTDSLEHTRERVASRWYALREVFGTAGPDRDGQVGVQEQQAPMLVVFSLVGGVGKTSLVATLGRSLAALGERVLLADTNPYGLLPFYYGARELRPAIVRTFSPPSVTGDAPVMVVNYDVDGYPSGENGQDVLLQNLVESSRSTNRVIVDLATASASNARRMLRLSPVVLIPIVPDMTSVLGLTPVQQFFRSYRGNDGQPIQPYYLLNQFDAAQPLHLDVREVLRQQLGDRLLPTAIRRSPAVSEALAEGMTVVDYAPKSPISEDFKNLAGWLRSVTAPEAQGFRGMRWSEK